MFVNLTSDNELALPFNEDLIYDTGLPAFVRAFFAFHLMSPMGALAIRQAGWTPRLFGKRNREPVEVVAIFRGLDVAIRGHVSGEYTRILRTHVSDFSATPYENLDGPT